MKNTEQTEHERQTDVTANEISKQETLEHVVEREKIRFDAKIAAEEDAILLSEKLAFDHQIIFHKNRLELLRRMYVVEENGYEQIEWDGQKYISCSPEEDEKIIPLLGLQAIQDTKDIFDDYMIWFERYNDALNGILVGRLVSPEETIRYVLFRWD